MTAYPPPVGFTTSIPVEVLLAAGRIPLDLNNVFIASEFPSAFVRRAEADGFPRNACAWIKGIYGVVRENGISDLVAVTQGDCSFTQALMEVLSYRGVRTVPFAFPFDRDPEMLALSIRKLCETYGTTVAESEVARERLGSARRTAREIDRLTWEEQKVTGEENHRWLVECSDFGGDPGSYLRRAEEFVAVASTRPPRTGLIPIGFIGVPPIVSGLHEALEEAGATVAFNETQRQFSMPSFEAESMVAQYLEYTYPYPVFERIADIKREIARRELRGLVHYVQSFCFRQIEDILLREEVGVPVLTLEGDAPGPVDGRTKIRLQAFAEMLKSG